MSGGPQPLQHQQRLELAHQIAEQIRQYYGERLLALGIFGSLARGLDGPYSDIEMFCVVQGEGVDEAFEWSNGPWKAEVDVYSQDTLLDYAAELDVGWSLTHSAGLHVLPVYDPQGFFPRLRQAILAHSDEEFRHAVAEMMVGEIYELVGKIRNAAWQRNHEALPFFAVELARDSACLVGLANHHLYTSAARMFAESLSLAQPPAGYQALCQMVMAGQLADPQRILAAVDALWAGMEAWADSLGLPIETTLDALIRSRQES